MRGALSTQFQLCYSMRKGHNTIYVFCTGFETSSELLSICRWVHDLLHGCRCPLDAAP